MEIRRATVDDARTLALLAARTFTEAFGHLYPPQDLQEFLSANYTVERQRLILARPEYAVWLLERDGEAVGHAAAGPCGLPHADARLDDGELKRLYVLAAHQNAGWGGRMFRQALDWLERDGPRALWIGVWSRNLGAQRFYARYGFVHAGEYEFPVGRARDREFILRRDAGAAPGR